MKRTVINGNPFHLIDEMFETIDLVRNFDLNLLQDLFLKVDKYSKWMITGEGSSRIFPGKNVLIHHLMAGKGPEVVVQDCTQLDAINLAEYLVFGASNSGQTKELIDLFRELHLFIPINLVAISSHRNTLLAVLANTILYTDFCVEKAVAATQSVIVQALIYDFLLMHKIGRQIDLNELADALEVALILDIPKEIVHALAKADRLFVVGNDNGVAEEIALKAMETIRKTSVFLPGTLLLHGVEEIVTENDVFLVFDSLPNHLEKIYEIYVAQIGAKVILIGQNHIGCLSIPIVTCINPFYSGYQRLALGWNILATTGIEMGIDIDKPVRARKIGNAY